MQMQDIARQHSDQKKDIHTIEFGTLMMMMLSLLLLIC